MKTSLALLLFILALTTSHAGPVSEHGRLQVNGRRITGTKGETVSLAGNSFFWSQWGGELYNAEAVNWLKSDWKTTIIRAVMGIEAGGYLEHPESEKAKIITLVDAAIAADLYVIIDWHDHHAHLHTEQAISFFQEMAHRYGKQPHVLYELYNEPLNTATWAGDVKPYAEKVIAAIRAIDPDNMILVGSPTWSQDVDVAAADPIKDNNVAYTLHFYAGTHKADLRAKALIALKKNIPLFVSEWGTCNADGDGNVADASTKEWMAFMREWQLSHCNWSVSTRKEAASIIIPGASATGHWPESDLTENGRVVREWVRQWAANPPVDPKSEK